MKRLQNHLSGLILAFIFSSAATAQSYTFTHFTAPYAPFSDGNEVDMDIICDDDIVPDVSIEFAFPYFNMTLESISIHSSFLLNETEINSVTYGAQFFPLWMKNECRQETSISYKTTGDPGNRIFTVQWQNMGAYDGNENDFLDVQALFYESDGAVEYRFGHVSIPAAAYLDDNQPGAFTAIMHYSYDQNENLISDPACLRLSGDAANPTAVSFNENDDPYTMIATPDSSMVYRFAPAGAGLKETIAPDFSVFPNPVSNTLNLSALSVNAIAKEIQVLNPEGKIVLKAALQSSQQTIDVSSLENGMYFIRLEGSSAEMLRFAKTN